MRRRVVLDEIGRADIDEKRGAVLDIKLREFLTNMEIAISRSELTEFVAADRSGETVSAKILARTGEAEEYRLNTLSDALEDLGHPSVFDAVPFAYGVSSVSEYCVRISRRLRAEADEVAQESRKRAFMATPAIAKMDGTERDLLYESTGDLEVAGPGDVHAADEFGAALHASAPWFRAASADVWRSLRGEIDEGRGAHVPPVLIYGPPGNGKTSWGRKIAGLMGAPLVEIDAGSGNSAFQIAGVERGWSTRAPGLPVGAILEHRVANPVIVLNEICQAGDGMRSSKGAKTSMSDALLPLLDRVSASDYRCPALNIRFDLSRVTWILTANTLDTITGPLLSRVRRIEAPMPSADDVRSIAMSGLSEIDGDIARDAADLVALEYGRGRATLRQVDTMILRVLRSVKAPLLH